ncbi:nuclear transport factor 2 family protein [Aquimarina sp. TRL1]|uniref:nuclear transport factor 2 family protein n=1 Tax=Aquimarina sp. (strain TRL1) TaxID=2736252 RepID=UPI00158E0D85|nr:nuclear transport factor 2 family protein [Aquimarina sp. TRL1]QKX05759.1 nuclear transport factor 2 family protein [Aquimarina sp. TRL1]
MKILIFLLSLISYTVVAQSNPKPQRSSKEVINSFFTHFSHGDEDGILSDFAKDAKIISINENGIKGADLYGTFTGHKGVQKFLHILASTFETKDFQIHHIISEDAIAFAQGSFIHKVKATDKLFKSDWVLMCEVENGKIATYRFFEDSASFLQASQK